MELIGLFDLVPAMLFSDYLEVLGKISLRISPINRSNLNRQIEISRGHIEALICWYDIFLQETNVLSVLYAIQKQKLGDPEGHEYQGNGYCDNCTCICLELFVPLDKKIYRASELIHAEKAIFKLCFHFTIIKIIY